MEFSLQFSIFFKIKQYQSFPVISVHVEKLCGSPLKLVSKNVSRAQICVSKFKNMFASG